MEERYFRADRRPPFHNRLSPSAPLTVLNRMGDHQPRAQSIALRRFYLERLT
jgi:hypothetical protein